MKYEEGMQVKNNKTNKIGTVVEVDLKNKRIKVRFVGEGEVWIDKSQIDKEW